MEEKFPPMAGGRLRQVAAQVDFQRNQERLIVRVVSTFFDGSREITLLT